MSVIEISRELSKLAHKGQNRKWGGLPFFKHPEEVARMVSLYLKTVNEPPIYFTQDKEIMISAAYLHDVLEDTDITRETLVAFVGEQITRLVEELTNASKGSSLPRKSRKQMDRAKLVKASWQARFIKLCDRICNLRDTAECPDTKFVKKFADESELLLKSLAGTYLPLEEVLFAEIATLKRIHALN